MLQPILASLYDNQDLTVAKKVESAKDPQKKTRHLGKTKINT